MNYPTSIQKLIDLFSKFPTVGPRTASRFVFYLMGLRKEEVEDLLNSVAAVRNKVKTCSSCFNPFEAEGKLCSICADPRRNKSLLCIVSSEIDLSAIEKTKRYQGLYFVLGGTISAFKKTEIEKLKIKDLEEKIKNNPEIKEIILAFNPTLDGEATTLYMERVLKSFNKKTSRLGRGLPVGGELEYADQETLSSALESRK